MTWDDAFRQLDEVAAWEDDWDGQGTNAPHPRLIEAARHLLAQLQAEGRRPPDRVSGTCCESVYVEWQSPKYYEEFEVVDPKKAEHTISVDGVLTIDTYPIN